MLNSTHVWCFESRPHRRHAAVTFLPDRVARSESGRSQLPQRGTGALMFGWGWVKLPRGINIHELTNYDLGHHPGPRGFDPYYTHIVLERRLGILRWPRAVFTSKSSMLELLACELQRHSTEKDPHVLFGRVWLWQLPSGYLT